jgi:manganese transport protein
MLFMASSKRSSKSPRSRLSNTDSTTRDAKAVLSGRSKKSWFNRLLPFLGPAFIASIAYVDPGNFATNIQGGAQFGYELLWVILGSSSASPPVRTWPSIAANDSHAP